MYDVMDSKTQTPVVQKGALLAGTQPMQLKFSF